MKHLFSLVLSAALTLLLLTGCAGSAPDNTETAAETRPFTDSLGRTVTLPAEIEKIAVSGPLAQVYVFPLCPELFAGFAVPFSEEALRYVPEEYRSLPLLGQLYGGKGTMDLEALLAAVPDVVIDVGEAKDGMAEELDALAEQVGIPFVHIEATTLTAAAAYRVLGELTGRTEKAEALALWCEETLQNVTDIMAAVDADGARKSVVYCLGDKGLNVLAEGSYHAETINFVSRNAAVLPDAVAAGSGNEVDPEQLLLWDPEVLIFAPDTVYDTVGTDTMWAQLDAVKNGAYYETPFGPYGWLASPPSVQRYLGLVWLTALLYPDYVNYNLQELVTEYYDLFYGFELTDGDYAALTANALPK